jgi:hypothetical protein
MVFTDVHPTDPQHPTTWQWTFSGCEAEPATSADPGPTVFAHLPGVLHAHSIVSVWDGTQYVQDVNDLDAYVIGGPIDISAEDRGQQREGRTDRGTEWQPNILEYFDYDLESGRPDAATQLENKLRAQISPGFSAQPSGTKYTWLLSGPVAFFGTDPEETSTSCEVYATAGSVRSGASVHLRFTYTLNIHDYRVDDTADAFHSKSSSPDTTYSSISCHRPLEARVAAQYEGVLDINGPPTWAYGDNYLMRLWSGVGDPFAEVWVQERFPNGVPTHYDDGQPLSSPFIWNGTAGTHWETVTTATPPAGFPTGYNYSGDFSGGPNGIPYDKIYFSGWPSQVPRDYPGPSVLHFTHVYYAATVNALAGFGIPVGTYVATLWTNKTTHIKQ